MGPLDESSLDIPAFKRLPETERAVAARMRHRPVRRLGLVAIGVGAVALGVAAALLARSDSPEGEVPLIAADSGPIRTRPEDSGGARIANQDRLVYERSASRQAEGEARLLPPPEVPIAPPAPPPVQVEAAAPVKIPPAPEPPSSPLASPLAVAAAASPLPVAETAQRAQPRVSSLPLPPPPPADPGPPSSTFATPVAASQLAVARAASSGRAGAEPGVPQGPLQVQLAAVGTPDAARSEWARLARRWPELLRGREPIVAPASSGNTTVYRLRTGGFADPLTASEFCDQIRSRGGQCVLARF